MSAYIDIIIWIQFRIKRTRSKDCFQTWQAYLSFHEVRKWKINWICMSILKLHEAIFTLFPARISGALIIQARPTD